MKLKLGEMTPRRCLTKSKASSSRTRWLCMRYARQIVAEREMPAWQCTSTRPPLSFTESAKEMGEAQAGRCTRRRPSPSSSPKPLVPTPPVLALRPFLPMNPMASWNQALISTIWLSSTGMLL